VEETGHDELDLVAKALVAPLVDTVAAMDTLLDDCSRDLKLGSDDICKTGEQMKYL